MEDLPKPPVELLDIETLAETLANEVYKSYGIDVNGNYKVSEHTLRDLAFECSIGLDIHTGGCDSNMYEKVDPKFGIQYQAHGIAKSNTKYMIASLLNLLVNGIDTQKQFYTAYFYVPKNLAGIGCAIGTSTGEAYKDGLAVVVGAYGRELIKDGIKIVLINDAYVGLLKPLSQMLGHKYKFCLLSQQKEALQPKY